MKKLRVLIERAKFYPNKPTKQQLADEADLLIYMQENAEKYLALEMAAREASGNYVTGLTDDDPHKGSLNRLADTLKALEAL